jgi:hypothetical protein
MGPKSDQGLKKRGVYRYLPVSGCRSGCTRPPALPAAFLVCCVAARPRYTPIWKLEAALKCRSCKKGRYAPPVHMIKLTETREITP